MKVKFVITLFFLLFINSNAQTKLDLAIKNLEENYAQEKIYILFDKENYIAGENIWFKALLFNGYQQSTISTNLFVELYDKNKTLINKKLLPIINGQSDGSFTLKDDLEENVYYIRAYTTYMTNFSEDFQYIKPILIYNPKSKLKLVKNENIKWDASVHPEGGTFIEKQTTKFAVRLKSIGDLPKKWKGFVFEKDNPSTKIVEFNNLDENIATFFLRAEPNKIYQIQINDENGNEQIIDIPLAKKDGVKLAIQQNSDFIRYSLTAINKNLNNYVIVGTINNKLVYKATIIDNRQTFSSKLPLSINDNQNGILNLHIFDENQNIVAHRLAFIFCKENESNNKIIKYLDNASQLYQTSTKIDTLNQKKYLSDLFLSSDMNFKIHNPSQYFVNNNQNNLDALLISEEWKRFNWNELDKTSKVIKVDSTFLNYTGNVLQNGKSLSNSIINLIVETDDGSKEFIQTKTDNLGKFTIDHIISYGNTTISYFTKDKNNLISLNIQSNNPFIPYKKSFETSNYTVTDKSEIEIAKSNITPEEINEKSKNNEIQLKTVELKSDIRNKTELLDKKISSQAFQAGTRKIFDFINGDYPQINTYPNIFSFLDQNLPNFNMDIHNGDYKIFLRGPILGSEVKVYLDETLISPELLETVNVNEIAMVKILNNSITSEAIAIYTKKGNFSPLKSKTEQKNKITVIGYNKSIPFLKN